MSRMVRFLNEQDIDVKTRNSLNKAYKAFSLRKENIIRDGLRYEHIYEIVKDKAVLNNKSSYWVKNLLFLCQGSVVSLEKILSIVLEDGFESVQPAVYAEFMEVLIKCLKDRDKAGKPVMSLSKNEEQNLFAYWSTALIKTGHDIIEDMFSPNFPNLWPDSVCYEVEPELN